ncbi:glycosyltransferase family 4 protein, partial [Undibacterium sp.]|uniref:glycosyltransferase family 4 protein n=1 Tax=Undibacterium sp. TaxID=1914977 RepID=UPI003753275E
KILFIHQNFPGQFKHLVPALIARGHQVAATLMSAKDVTSPPNLTLHTYYPKRFSTPNIHPWLIDMEAKTIRAEAMFHALMKLKAEGYEPDLIIAHPGWGESLFVKQVWPNTKLAIYCEFFYEAEGQDMGFDPEFPRSSIEDACRLMLKNNNNYLHFDIADAGISPTRWQQSTFPMPFRDKISVIHDGIDTNVICRNDAAIFDLDQGGSLSKSDEVITFVNRNLEPYRGYHIFMRALPQILQARPQAKVVIVGGDDVSYGAKPDNGKNWKQIFLEEVSPQLTDEQLARIHFVGKIAYPRFVRLLQASSLHVYLTYPFVLSWSLLEAMSTECAILASDTSPLHEAITDGVTGCLVDFFDVDALASKAIDLLADPATRARLGKNARQFAREHYDLKTQCLPQQLAWVDSILSANRHQ